MIKSKISIIIPTFNKANFLPKAIQSVFNQTYQNFELIVVDDGSTDNTKEVVKKFQTKDKRIKYFFQENSGGAAKPKNVGIKNASGEYIAILDADDEWLSEKLELQLKLLEDQRLDFVGCYSLVIDAQNNFKSIYIIPNYKNVLDNILMRDYMGSGSSMMYRKDIFDKSGLFDENLKTAQDWEMRIRLAQEYKFAPVEKVLFKYYVHENNISSSVPYKEKLKDLDYIYNKYIAYYQNNPKLYSIKLRYDGTRSMLAQENEIAGKCFMQSIKADWLNLKSYIYFFLSLFGTSCYLKLTKIKSKL